MANKKITDLTELTEVASDDYLEIVDTSANASKKISRENLIAGHDHDSDYVPLSYKDGWIPVSGTWTYKTATTITVPSGAASIYKVGMGIRLTQSSTVKYFYIVGVADTVLTITGGSDYALEDATISAVSYTNSPATTIGFPQWFNWTPVVGGTWAAGYTVNVARFNLIGRTCFFTVDISGTSNSTDTQIGVPLRSYNTAGAIWAGTNAYMQDNGTALSVAGRWYLAAGSTIIYARTNMASGAWTASGAKRLRITGFYEIA